jgi:hypothetical protein
MVGYNKVVDALNSVTREDLAKYHEPDGSVQGKFMDFPLKDFLLALVSMLQKDSQECQELTKKTSQQTSHVFYTPLQTSETESHSPNERPTTPDSSLHRFPTSFVTPDNKRTASEASLETRSNLTTPKKLMQPEAKVQSLQNLFVGVVLNHIYCGQVPIPWADGRYMFLTYIEYLSFATADDRTAPTSFQYTCQVNENQKRKGRVRAVADGALRPMTDHPSNPGTNFYWGKQKTVLSFEVFVTIPSAKVGKKSERTMGGRVTADRSRKNEIRCDCRNQGGATPG